MSARQSAKLLPALFENVTDEQRVTVLHVGPALPETVNFFSNYRCRLHFVDPYGELPLVEDLEEGVTLRGRVDGLFTFPGETRFDLCLFWDVFNYLSAETANLVSQRLRPHLLSTTLAHAFGVHNTRSPQRDCTYSIDSPEELVLRDRPAPLPGYAPLPQSKLKEALTAFEMKRSVLLADSRLELLLAARGG